MAVSRECPSLLQRTAVGLPTLCSCVLQILRTRHLQRVSEENKNLENNIQFPGISALHCWTLQTIALFKPFLFCSCEVCMREAALSQGIEINSLAK